MTVTLTDGALYLIVVLLLMGVQVYQQVQIRKNRKEIDKLWEQIGTIAYSISIKMIEMQKDITTKEDKK